MKKFFNGKYIDLKEEEEQILLKNQEKSKDEEYIKNTLPNEEQIEESFLKIKIINTLKEVGLID